MSGLRVGELFAGVGGLGMAVSDVFDAEIAWVSEIEKAPSRVLAYRFPGVPNLGDVRAVDFGAVDRAGVLCGGFPCQDVSTAGARAGLRDGTRSGLWSEFARAIEAQRPDWVVIENVGGLLSAEADSDVESCAWCVGDGSGEPAMRALGAVLADLAGLGFDAEWTSVRASDVGAPHRRLRVFILAWPAERTAPDAIDERYAGSGGGGHAAEQSATPGGLDTPAADVRPLPTPVVNDMGDGKTVKWWDTWSASLRAKGLNGNGHGPSLAVEAMRLMPTPGAYDGDRGGAQDPAKRREGGHSVSLQDAVMLLTSPQATRGGAATEASYALGGSRDDAERPQGVVVPGAGFGEFEAAVRRWERVTGTTAPSPVDGDRLNAAFSEWMMGWPVGWVTDPAVGLTRAEQLRAIGNGVVPQQAAAALRVLLDRPGVPALQAGVAA